MPSDVFDYNPTPVAATAAAQKQGQADQYGHVLQAPPSHSVVVNVSSTDQALSPFGRWIYIGGSGNLVCRLVGDTSDQTFTGLLAGTTYALAISIIRKTNTTITNSVVMW